MKSHFYVDYDRYPFLRCRVKLRFPYGLHGTFIQIMAQRLHDTSGVEIARGAVMHGVAAVVAPKPVDCADRFPIRSK